MADITPGSKASQLNSSVTKSKNSRIRISLVARWIRICLPMQGTWVQSQFQEDSTCHGATKSGSPQLEKACVQQHRHSATKNKGKNKKKKNMRIRAM